MTRITWLEASNGLQRSGWFTMMPRDGDPHQFQHTHCLDFKAGELVCVMPNISLHSKRPRHMASNGKTG